jgi:CRP-like cAMP-binding protein
LLAWTSRLASPQRRGPARGRHEKLPASDDTGLTSLHHDADEDFQITISPETLRATDFSIKSRFLSRLPHGKQSELMGMTAPGKHDRHTVVMHQGDPGVSLFVISSGKVQISRRGENGGERVVSVLGEGDTFGERAVLLKKPYSETALTLSECQITEIKSEQLYAFANQYPSLKRIIDEYKSGDVAQKAQVATLTIRK